MKKFTKLFLSCAAVAAVTAAVATSAMAANLAGVQYATDEGGATGTVTITLPTGFTDATKTLLILKPGADKTNIDTAKILQIDQKSEAGALTEVTAKVEALSADNTDQTGTYTVLMGGTEGVIYEGSFYVGNGQPILVGDANLDGSIKSGDSTAVLWYGLNASKAASTGKTINLSDGTTALVGDANLDGSIKSGDATAILWYGLNADKAAKVGETITGTVVDTPAAE